MYATFSATGPEPAASAGLDTPQVQVQTTTFETTVGVRELSGDVTSFLCPDRRFYVRNHRFPPIISCSYCGPRHVIAFNTSTAWRKFPHRPASRVPKQNSDAIKAQQEQGSNL